MSIPFTQYLRPDGRTRHETVDRPAHIEALAQEFIKRGGRFEAEMLTTGHVSLTACVKVEGEPTDIAIRICDNGPAVLEAVDELVKEASEFDEAKWLAADAQEER